MPAADPIGEFARSEARDMAYPQLFLSSYVASFITGQILFADGGKSLR